MQAEEQYFAQIRAAKEPQIVEFGPYRVIGMRYAGKNAQDEVKALWETFFPRMGEVERPAGCGYAFGLCRCLPGVTDGSFEYIAALPATPEAPMPEGMVEAPVAAASYVAFPVPSLAVIKQAWDALGPWIAAHPEWEPYCGLTACQCPTHPTFELYPPDYTGGAFFIYMPVRRKG